jgi:hypothetical protein
VLDPFDRRIERPRLHRHAQDDLILDDEARDRLLHDARLRRD